jgi:ribosomal protein S18 acetylase RimI-like enzyme
MPDLNCIPISYFDPSLLFPLMDEEERAWMSDLGWDYSPIRKILVSYVRQKLLPGYVAVNAREAVGYTYFLVNQTKGIIGAIYASRRDCAQEVVDELLSLTISSLKEKDSPQIKRVEAQIMPFNGLNLTPAFSRNGFTHYPRFYLDLELDSYRGLAGSDVATRIIPWDPSYLPRAAEMVAASYRDQLDAILCADYRTEAGCESYIRSLVENPGCGIFMPEASFIALDEQGMPCGFVITCRISGTMGIIPQIAVHPSYQGHSLGNILMNRAIEQLKASGFLKMSLTVTKENRRAFQWYQRLGFCIRKEFGAYVWER